MGCVHSDGRGATSAEGEDLSKSSFNQITEIKVIMSIISTTLLQITITSKVIVITTITTLFI